MYVCRQGHRWDHAEEEPAAPGAQIFCPVCGTTAHPGYEVTLYDSAASRPGEADQWSSAADGPAPSVPTLTAPPSARPAAIEDPRADEPPVIPGYEILGELGHGGMGIVYKARHLPLNRLVALKMILAGAHADPEQLARFHVEAETLAGLQHSNIVQLYAVGSYRNCPYFSLEYVDGGNLDDRIAGQPWRPDEAARMVETLARAMHSAHLRGIVHRDLKPANVLLTRDGVPKITDFGLAKRLEEAGQTQSGVIMGTPAYMAPEQALGLTKQVGPAADIYALGAILYELLTGRPPFWASTTIDTLIQVQTSEPVRPRRLVPRLPRDLETICLKALNREPVKRYVSAEALAEDLRRFRAGEPITARPVGVVERGVKWARRRPAGAALVALCGLLVAGLTVGGFWLADYERRRADAEIELRHEALDVVNHMVTRMAEERLAHEPRMTRVRQQWLEEALAFYLRYLERWGHDPRVRRETARAYQRVGDIYRLQEQHTLARDAYARAIGLLDALAAQHPDNLQYVEDKADCCNWLGESLRKSGRPDDARKAFLDALALQERLLAHAAREPRYLLATARCHNNLGILAREGARPDEAQAEFGRAIAIQGELVRRFPGVPAYRQELARTLSNLGSAQRLAGRSGDARASYERAIAELVELRRKDARHPEYRCELGVAYNNLGNLLGRCPPYTSAAEAHQEARQLFDQLVKEFPDVPAYREELGNTCNSLGALMANTERFADAEALWHEASTHFEDLLRLAGEMPAYHGRLGVIYANLGWLFHEKLADPRKARTYLEKAIPHLKAALKPNPNHPEYGAALESAMSGLAELAGRRQPEPP
jgi:tetratricopeptide (TPR) repeat protein